MSNPLKMVARFPVTHRIMGTPLTLFKMWDFCPLQSCTHTHAKGLWWLRYFMWPTFEETCKFFHNPRYCFLQTKIPHQFHLRFEFDVKKLILAERMELHFYQGCSFRCITSAENWPGENLNKIATSFKENTTHTPRTMPMAYDDLILCGKCESIHICRTKFL